jgi:ribosomal silencing factor RsfS
MLDEQLARRAPRSICGADPERVRALWDDLVSTAPSESRRVNDEYKRVTAHDWSVIARARDDDTGEVAVHLRCRKCRERYLIRV